MDKATSSYQVILWHLGECCLYSNLDCSMLVPYSGSCQEKMGIEQSLYTISQTLGFVLFEKVPINQLFNKNQNAVSTDDYPNLLNMS